jgi:hypothetical protein
MEDNNNMDTPQPQTPNTGTTADPYGAPADSVEGSNNDNLSVEDAFFSRAEEEGAQAPGNTGQPDVVEQPADNKNDDTRYEYWQSQAAKKENELNQFKAQVQQAVQRDSIAAQQAQTVQEPQADEFPPPPSAPEKPAGFNRQEAWDDPSSPSAQYLDAKEKWQDNMNEYRDLRNQYEIASMRESMETQERQKRAVAAKQQEYRQQKAQENEIFNHVQGHHGLSREEAVDFMQTMSNPDSLSIDNLVSLYRINRGQGNVNPQSQGPSETFQQSRNAQQVPSPMGVMPGQSNQPKNDSDTIMDDLITSHKSKNPWT